MQSALPEDALVLTVRAVLPATPTARILRLDLNRAPFAFAAGQAALIGPAGQDLRIPYSIASAAGVGKRTFGGHRCPLG
jgi:NAD(P)H-flavin reductase